MRENKKVVAVDISAISGQSPVAGLTVDQFCAVLDQYRPVTPPEPEKHFIYGRKELASLLGMSLSTVQRVINSGVLPTYRYEDSLFWEEGEVLEALKVAGKKIKGK